MATSYFEISVRFHHQRYGCVLNFSAIIGLRIWLWFLHDIVRLFDYAHVNFYEIGLRVRMRELWEFEVRFVVSGVEGCWKIIGVLFS